MSGGTGSGLPQGIPSWMLQLPPNAQAAQIKAWMQAQQQMAQLSSHGVPPGAPPHWPAGIPFPPTPGGLGLPPLTGGPLTPAQAAQWVALHQQQQNLQHAQWAAQQAPGSWLQVSAPNAFGASMAVAALSRSASPHLRPDPAQPDTLGWREWRWVEPTDPRHIHGHLESPSQRTPWPEAELVVPHWDDGDAVRGVSGIHAHLVPKHWKIVCQQSGEYVALDDPMRVHGIVERFGKYVLGTEGWRAEWVIIKELMAPSTEVGLKIEQAYPDVIVHYPEEDGGTSCTSVTSSKWGKGNRSTSRPRPSPSPSQSTPSVAPSPALSQTPSQSPSNGNASPRTSSLANPNRLPLYASGNSSPSESAKTHLLDFWGAALVVVIGAFLLSWLVVK